MDFSTLSIRKIIVHDIPKHLKNDLSETPRYSQKESTVTNNLKSFFKDKIIQSLMGSRAFKISRANDNESATPLMIEQILQSNGENLVVKSRNIAKNLFEIQVGNNAAGILVVIYSDIQKKPVCIIMKLERDMGAQLKLDEKTRSFDIEEIQDLMLTQKTRIFKVALFFKKSDFGVSHDGLLTDYQIDLKAKKDIQTWFMNTFLGYQAFADPQITTKKFYTYTRSFINTLDDEIEKVKYLMDLNSYIQKNNTTISAKEFADDYLQNPQEKNTYKTFIESKDIEFGSFIKDATQIEREIHKIIVSFENGISLVGNKGMFDENVTLENLDDGQHRAEIISKIKNIS